MDLDKLNHLISIDYSSTMLARELGVSKSTIRYWLNKYGLKTTNRARYRNSGGIWSTPEDKFIDIISSSNSINDALRKLDVNTMTANYRSLKRRCKSIGMEPPIWDGSRYSYKEENPLIENSISNRARVKKHILNKDLIKYECAICKLPPVWNGIALVLTLDHINGVNNDNRINNLRFLCPNCDRQLPTYCYKNRKDIGV